MTVCLEHDLLLIQRQHLPVFHDQFAVDDATLKIEDLMEDLKKELTIVIVTHNMQQATRIADRTAFMYMGRLVEYGETSQIFTNPTEKETEAYITGRFS